VAQACPWLRQVDAIRVFEKAPQQKIVLAPRRMLLTTAAWLGRLEESLAILSCIATAGSSKAKAAAALDTLSRQRSP
jgi:hypothetical protein